MHNLHSQESISNVKYDAKNASGHQKGLKWKFGTLGNRLASVKNARQFSVMKKEQSAEGAATHNLDYVARMERLTCQP